MKLSNAHALIAIAATALLTVPALAQVKDGMSYDVAQQMQLNYDGDQIIVIAPRYESERTASGARIETRTEHRSVSAADLDLRNDAHVEELRRRVQTTAIEACNDIERSSDGVMLTRDHECVRGAERSASAEINAMVYAARS